MPGFDGYLSHQLIDDPGHLLLISECTSREHADASLREYAGHPKVLCVNALISRPRARFVGRAAPFAL